MLRLFVCIWIPDHIKKKIQKFQEKMASISMKANFVELDNLHITITFLGNVKNNKLKSLTKKLDLLTQNKEKFFVKLENMKFIPNEKYVRIIGIEAVGDQIFTNLIKCIGDNLKGKYHEKTKLTLCRVKNVLEKEMFKEFIKKNRNVHVGEFQVESISLVKSELTSSGPIYKTLHTSMLR